MSATHIFRSLIAAWAVLVLGACKTLGDRRVPEGPRPIWRTEQVTLGGWPQTIQIRGGDVERNPVLLFLHGGPGLPEMPVAYRNAELERSFTIVQWDQRGAGKSFRFGTPDLTAKRLLGDTLELSRQLKQRFGGRKIYLVGFSWGSLLGARAVAHEPDLYAGYIGLSQLVNIHESIRTLYEETLAKARQEPALAHARRDLEHIGPPPWKDAASRDLAQYWWKELEGPVPNKMKPLPLTLLCLNTPAYTPFDFMRAFFGALLSYPRLESDIYAADLFREVPRLEVPAWFLIGRHDTVVSGTVAERYFQKLKAPQGKHLVWFENSDHAPHLEEPEKYRAVMMAIRRATWAGYRDAGKNK